MRILNIAYNLSTLLLGNFIIILPVLHTSHIEPIHLACTLCCARILLDVRHIGKLISIANAPTTCKKGYAGQQSLSKALGYTLCIIFSLFAHPWQIADSLFHVAYKCGINLVSACLTSIDVRQIAL